MARKFIFGGSFLSCPIEAITYLNAQGITNPAVRSNYCQLVSEWQSDGVYSFVKVCYPSLGDSASTNNLNAINPIDSDVAYRREFSGGFSSFSPVTGIKGDGITGHYRTHYNTNNMTLASGGGAILEVLSEGSDGVDLRATSPGVIFGIASKFAGFGYYHCNNGDDNFNANLTATGIYLINRPPATSTFFDYSQRGTDYVGLKSYLNPNAEIFGLSTRGLSQFTDKSQGALVIFTGATTAQAKLIRKGIINFNARR